MNESKLGVIIPVFGHFDYAARAAETAVTKSCTYANAIIVNDGSPGGLDSMMLLYHDLAERLPQRVFLYHYDENRGLTWAWNEGLRLARERGCTHVCCANSDVVFARGWDVPIVAALEERGFALIGPVTNAPGTEEIQDVRKHYIWPYTVGDDQSQIDVVGRRLTEDFGSEVRQSTINGFCMVARTETWWANSFDGDHVFKPRNDYNSQGRVNADPLNTLQEYELQRRWHAAGLRTGYCPGSFVFHYRSVTRGDRFKRGGWHRKAGS